MTVDEGFNGISSDELTRVAKQTFKTNTVTMEQLKYVITMLTPSAYLLAHHTVKGHPFTFSIPNRDSSRAISHRPWQIDIVNDQHPNKVVEKSRQLGLSEISVAEMLWFADRYSEDKIKALYTFPTYRALEDFVKTRLNPVIHAGYYSTILSTEGDSVKSKKFRDSFLLFRTSGTASAVEGVDIDYLALDE